MLNPLLLLFLPLAAIPIVLHLIVLRRIRTVELPTLRFLAANQAQQRRRVWLIELLVMLLRTAVVALLVLMLSRPVVQRFDFLFADRGGQDVAIVMDGSSAMALRSDGTTSMERARSAAAAVLDLLSPADHVTVLVAGDEPQVLARGFAGQDAALRAAIEAIEPRGSADLAAAVHAVLTREARGPRVLYLIGDGRRQAWMGFDRSDALAQARPEPRVVVIDIGPAQPQGNLAVIGQPPQTIRPIVGLPVQLTATVVNYGQQPADTTLRVMLDDEQAAAVNLSLAAGQTLSRTLTVTPTRPGLIRGRFELPTDAFPLDDQYLFCLNVEDQLRALIVAGAGEQAASQPALYLQAALRSPLHADSGFGLDVQRLAEALRIDAIGVDQLNEERLGEADVVILADAPLDRNKGLWLRRYVEAGGGLLILPGPTVAPRNYERHLFTAADSDDRTLVRFSEPVGNADDESRFMPISVIDTTHPVLSVFDEVEAGYFSTVRLYRRFPIRPGDDNHRAVTMLRLPDGSAALSELRLGRGRIILAAFPATPDWSNLPLKPEFVPLLLRSSTYLCRPPLAQVRQAVTTGEPATIRLTDRWSDAQVQALDPRGRPRTVTLHRDDQHRIGAVLDTQQPGYYVFDILPRAEGVADRIQLGAAVNPSSAAAGDFARIDPDQARQALAPIEPVWLQGSPQDLAIGEQLAQRSEAWRTLIWIMLAFMAVEFMIATLRPVRDPTAAGGAGLQPRGPIARLADRGSAMLRRAGVLESLSGTRH